MSGDELKNGVIRYWQVIVVVGLGLIGWGSLHTKVSALETAVAYEKTESKEQGNKQGETEKAIVRIETRQESMRRDVDGIREEQREQSRKLDEILRKLSQE